MVKEAVMGEATGERKSLGKGFVPGNNGRPAPKTWLNRPLNQVVRIQNVLFEAIDGGVEKNLELSSLARAWADIEERRRILIGAPLPGSLRPEKKPRKQRQSTAPSPIRRPAIPQPIPQPVASCGVQAGNVVDITQPVLSQTECKSQ